jgi:hypothetical protein
MSALELFAVAKRGRLTRDDLVREGLPGDWVRAETVGGLFDGSHSAVSSGRITFPPNGRLSPRPALHTIGEARERYWVRHEAEIAGPFSDRRIRRLAAMGKLKPEYLVSRDRREWHPVADFVNQLLARR